MMDVYSIHIDDRILNKELGISFKSVKPKGKLSIKKIKTKQNDKPKNN